MRSLGERSLTVLNRMSWLFLGLSVFAALVLVGAAAYGRSVGANDPAIYLLAVLFVVVGIGLFFGCRGIVWALIGFADGQR